MNEDPQKRSDAHERLEHREVPDTSRWQPRAGVSDTLAQAFLARCKHIEEVIKVRASQERELNIDNFDSGWSLEEIVRDELGRLLPHRYSVHAGVINDRFGKTAGDCDVIISNDIWFPLIKAGVATESRRLYFPIEAVYGVLEVKQTLNFETLDKAASKLVSCHRLHRPGTGRTRMAENRKLDDCPHGTGNPLYSAILATGVEGGLRFEDLIDRFFYTCKTLKRNEVIHALCVLGEGTVTWGYRTADGRRGPARFMEEDLCLPIIPLYHHYNNYDSAFYPLMADLLHHLYHSVLAPEDVAALYGPGEFRCTRPKEPEVRLDPDEDPWASFGDADAPGG